LVQAFSKENGGLNFIVPILNGLNELFLNLNSGDYLAVRFGSLVYPAVVSYQVNQIVYNVIFIIINNSKFIQPGLEFLKRKFLRGN